MEQPFQNKLSIIIPCYNEAKNLPALIAAYIEIISDNFIEIIIINNGSNDETAVILKQLAPTAGFLRIITLPINQGYGGGILAGLRAASGEFVGWTHGDLQTPPSAVMNAFNLLKQNNFSPDLYIKGTRSGRSFFDLFFTWGMSIFEIFYLRTWLFDINAQPNIFHRSFFAKWKTPPIDFALDLYALYFAKKQRLNIIRFSVPFLRRVHGESKWNTGWLAKIKFIKRTLVFSVALKTRGQI